MVSPDSASMRYGNPDNRGDGGFPSHRLQKTVSSAGKMIFSAGMASLVIVSVQVTLALPLLDVTSQIRKRVSIDIMSFQNSSMICISRVDISKESQLNCKGKTVSSKVLSNTG